MPLEERKASARLRKSTGNRRASPRRSRALFPPMSLDRLYSYWRMLAHRYFDNRLPPIRIEWSARLTASAGLFVSRVGPRSRRNGASQSTDADRLIRLSLPLLADQPDREIVRTLAHEMIHQWQYDVRRCRPSHGRDFRDKMEELNKDGLEITIRHTFNRQVEALARYAWRCRRCGTVYQRQRRTISPQRHRCGYCHGLLEEDVAQLKKLRMNAPRNRDTGRRSAAYKARTAQEISMPTQLQFDFMGRPS